jgi:hypothetical protein
MESLVVREYSLLLIISMLATAAGCGPVEDNGGGQGLQDCQ